VPIRIPSSPNLADLQPKDPAKQFAYYELQIVLWIAADERWSTDAGGYAALYGNDDHTNTMLTLEPANGFGSLQKGASALMTVLLTSLDRSPPRITHTHKRPSFEKR
jgi:hypothetical protein